ncbi:MAG: AtpZ/AtpI family protein [Bacteroidales bacterium]|nr:AtpZ/AtpI family protein [Bacteroidales bacterium]
MKNQKDTSKKAKPDPLKTYAAYSSLGIQMVLIILAGAFGGRELDKVVSWEFPVFTLSLTIFALILAMLLFIKELFRKNK